jgi:threonine/homoserine/homoserine lactone efflux protein
MEYLAFIGICFLATASPGPAVFKAMQNGALHGIRLSLIGIIGNICALAIVSTLSVSGVSALLLKSAFLFSALKLCGAGYLIWLGIKMLKTSTSNASVQFSAETTSAQTCIDPKRTLHRVLFWESFFVGISNPKAILFFAALFPQFMTVDQNLLLQCIGLSVTFFICSFLSLSFYAVISSKARKNFKNSALNKWINRVFGSLMIGFGVALGANAKV